MGRKSGVVTGWNLFIRGMMKQGVTDLSQITVAWWSLSFDQRLALNKRASCSKSSAGFEKTKKKLSSGKTVFCCDHCGVEYQYVRHLRHHMKHCKQSKPESCRCEFCEKCLASPYCLKRHLVVCKKRKQALFYTDEQVLKEMSQKWSHLMEKKYLFVNGNHVERFSCVICAFPFTSEWIFYAHMEDCIAKTKPEFKCCMCAAQLKSEQQLTFHLAEVHGDFSKMQECKEEGEVNNREEVNQQVESMDVLGNEKFDDVSFNFDSFIHISDHDSSDDVIGDCSNDDKSKNLQPPHCDFTTSSDLQKRLPNLPHPTRLASTAKTSRRVPLPLPPLDFVLGNNNRLVSFKLKSASSLVASEMLKCDLCVFNSKALFESEAMLSQHYKDVHQITSVS